MSTKHIRTASDLVRFKAALKVECGACGNSLTLGGFELARVCGSGDLASIRTRMKCSLCGAREAKLSVLPPPARR
jgi:hypothetical protein